MTQQNSALVEEASAAAEALRDQAEQLSSVLSVFKSAPVSSAPTMAARVTAPAKVKPVAANKPAPVAKAVKAIALDRTAGGSSDWEEF